MNFSLDLRNSRNYFRNYISTSNHMCVPSDTARVLHMAHSREIIDNDILYETLFIKESICLVGE